MLSQSAYGAIAAVVAARVADGTYPPGSWLPPEPVLAGEFGVSGVTVNRALQQLVADGTLQVSRGRGFSVAVDPTVVVAPGKLAGWATAAAEVGAVLIVRWPDGRIQRVLLADTSPV